MQKEPVFTAAGPVQNAPYTPGVKVGNTLYVSGQVPIDASGKVVRGGFEAQVHQVFANMKALLETGGSGLEHVVKTTVFLSDLNNFGELNKLYGPYFPGVKPARSCVQAARLPLDSMVEIEAIALVP
jgi:2-iminobutanoate/2-iminopropanoate deaminase